LRVIAHRSGWPRRALFLTGSTLTTSSVWLICVVSCRILLAGDSVGGNLAAAMCLKAIMEKERVPDGY
jgi:hypothetical protein